MGYCSCSAVLFWVALQLPPGIPGFSTWVPAFGPPHVTSGDYRTTVTLTAPPTVLGVWIHHAVPPQVVEPTAVLGAGRMPGLPAATTTAWCTYWISVLPATTPHTTPDRVTVR